MSSQTVVGLALVAIVAFLFWPTKEEWTGIVYPNAPDLTEYQNIGVFESLESCRSFIVERMSDTNGHYDFECGLNCEPWGNDMLKCERTEG